MDTSTPLKKLRYKQFESVLPNEYIADCSGSHSKQETKQLDCDRFQSSSYPKWTGANTSVEVFPVSPICCAKDATSDLPDIPNLCSSNLKWSSSLHTSYAEDEVVEMETEYIDSICTQYQAAETGTTDTPATFAAASDESERDDTLVDEPFASSRNATSSNVMRSPVFASGAKRTKIKVPPNEQVAERKSSSEGEDTRVFCALKLDDYYCQAFEPCQSTTITAMTTTTTTTSKTSRYSFDSRRENSKRFVYPFAGVSIRKPRRLLDADQLTNCALTLESSDTTRSSVDGVAHVARARAQTTKDNISTQEYAVANAMVAFSQLYDEDRVVGKKIGDVRVLGQSFRSVKRALADLMFGRKNNDARAIDVRFDKMADLLAKTKGNADGGHSLRARVTRSLYSMYYFVTRVDLVSFKTDNAYKHASVQQLIRRVSISFKLEVSFDYASNLLERFANDIYVLERIGVPVAGLYATRSKALHCLRPIGGAPFICNDHTADRTVQLENLFSSVATTYEQSANYDGSKSDPPPLGFKTSPGRPLGVGDESTRVSTRLFSDITNKDECNFSGGEMSTASLVFKTGSGRAIKVDDESLRISALLFSDVSTEDERNFGCGKTTSASGFKTGSGKEIKLDDETLRTSARLFSDISTEDGRNFDSGEMLTASSGFKTGSGRAIKVDGESFRISARLFSDVSTEDERNFGCGKTTSTSGFKTGSGKAIKLDDKSLRTSARLFSDISTEDERNFGSGQMLTASSDFKTGSGRAIKVDNESLRISDVSTENERNFGCGKTTSTSGFKTGSGKAIKLDDTSLRTSARLFSDISAEDERNFGGRGSGGERITSSGFKTSSGKAISVDDESLRTCARLFSDISTEDERNFGGRAHDAITAASGFKTSSGRAINVDDKFARMEVGLVSDISTEDERNFGCGKTTTASSFKTSSGKAISVDGESLQIFGRLFSDISTEGECGFGGGGRRSLDKSTTTCGFKTSTGRTINVEHGNLRKSAQLFSDMLNVTGAQTRAAAGAASIAGAGNVGRIEVESLTKSDNLLAELELSTPDCVHQLTAGNESSDRESSSLRLQNQSFDLSREITEITSAFLYDISHERSRSSVFAPNESDANASIKSPVDNRADVKNTIAGSRSSSPVFVSKYGAYKRKNSTKKSGGRRSLDITYVRKTQTSDGNGNATGNNVSNDGICAELETLKMNFSCKGSKRKSISTDEAGSHIATKKRRNNASESPSREIEQLAISQIRVTPVARQRNYISNKPKQDCRPTRGYLSTLIYGGDDSDPGRSRRHSRDDRISLGRLARYEKPKFYSFDEYVKFGLLPAVIRVNSQNARHFVFTSQFFSDQQMKSSASGVTLFGDAVPVLLNEKNQVTLEEVTEGFLASPGIDPKLVSREWIANHYRWIVWKLASTEKFFPASFGRRYLTLDNVLFQLKFKYEQEVDRCVRSALKRILEGDDSPARPIILCVASIVKETHSSDEYTSAYKMELTDGWYSIFAQIDRQIDDFISRKKLLVGTKLIIAGAELVGLHEHCDPLQATENVRLKFSANSSRRVRWDTRLGFYNGKLGPMNRIQTILPKGGVISHLSAVVARVYPSLFLEKYDNPATNAASATDVSANGISAVTATWSRLHNEKVEMKKAMAFERDRQNYVESILSQVTNQVLSENTKTDTDAVTDKERLRDIIQQRVQSRLPVKFSKNRHVNRLLKLRLVDAQDAKNKSSAILTIWNPCDDVTNFFKEGRSYRFFNINANCIRNGELQLCSIRSSKYDVDSSTGSNGDNSGWFGRRVHNVQDFEQRCEDVDKRCLFDEVDVTGIVIKIEPKTEKRTGPHPQSFHHQQQSCRIYLADLQRRFFALSFRIDPKNFDFGDSIESGKIVAGVNLQWKNGWLCWKIPVLYVSELSCFVQTTNIVSLRQSIEHVRRYFQTRNLETFVAECEEELKAIVDSAAETSANVNSRCENLHRSSGSGSGSAVVGVDAEITTTVGVDRATPSTKSDSCNKAEVVVGNQSTFKNSDMRSKFERLQNYGRPPALSPIVLASRSKIKANLSLPISRRSFKS